ncbi:MAG TPA: hypothetical protein VGK48_14625 [Terriglobia bacterium]|jgi:formate-dependent nitrite reductase cytochrome c552 subunit
MDSDEKPNAGETSSADDATLQLTREIKQQADATIVTNATSIRTPTEDRRSVLAAVQFSVKS